MWIHDGAHMQDARMCETLHVCLSAHQFLRENVGLYKKSANRHRRGSVNAKSELQSNTHKEKGPINRKDCIHWRLRQRPRPRGWCLYVVCVCHLCPLPVPFSTLCRASRPGQPPSRPWGRKLRKLLVDLRLSLARGCATQSKCISVKMMNKRICFWYKTNPRCCLGIQNQYK